jgi:2-iminobutanoate/2-iminopropanoate deaminase
MTGMRKPLRSSKVKRPLGTSSHAWSISGPGRMIFTSGMTSRDNVTGAVVHINDIQGQTRQTLKNLKLVLAEDGAGPEHVIKLTVFLTRLEDFDGTWEGRNEFFPKDAPAASTVIVSSLADKDMLIEIEAVAFVP